MACIYEDVLSAAFQDGEIDFELDFLPTELSNAALVETPSAKQSANLKLSVPSCAKPELDANQFILGTPEDRFVAFLISNCVCEAVHKFGFSFQSLPLQGNLTH